MEHQQEEVKMEANGPIGEPTSVTFCEDPKGVASVAKKMAAAMGEVRQLSKGGVNRHDNYRYVEAAAVSDMVRALLAKNGLALIPSMRKVDIQSRPKGVIARVDFDILLVCGETGGWIAFKWTGEAADFGMADKAINKAATAAVKYATLKVFCMSTGDEADADAGGDREVRDGGAPPAQREKPGGRAKGKPKQSAKATKVQIERMRKLIADAGGDWEKFTDYVAERQQGVPIEEVGREEANQWIKFLEQKSAELSGSNAKRAAAKIRDPGEGEGENAR